MMFGKLIAGFCIMELHDLESHLLKLYCQEIQQEEIAEDQEERAIHDAGRAIAAWPSRMSWRLKGRTWRILTRATQVMPNRFDE